MMNNRVCGINGVMADDFVEFAPLQQELLIKQWSDAGLLVLGLVAEKRFLQSYRWDFIFMETPKHGC